LFFHTASKEKFISTNGSANVRCGGFAPFCTWLVVGCLAVFPCYLPPLFGYVVEILVAHFVERSIALSHKPLRNERLTVRVIGRIFSRTEMVVILLSTVCEAERVLQDVQFFVGYFHLRFLSFGAAYNKKRPPICIVIAIAAIMISSLRR